MGGEGTIAGMIISLRNNANLRLGRKKYFRKYNPSIGKKGAFQRVPKHKKRTALQIEKFRRKEKKRKKREMRIQVFALLISFIVALVVLYLIFGTSLFVQ